MQNSRAFAEQRAQYQVVRPDGVTSDWRALTASNLTVTEERETDKITPSGEYFPTLTYEKSRNTTGEFEGLPCYRELADVFEFSLGSPVTTEDPNGLYKHEFVLKPDRPMWNIQYGDTQSAQTTFKNFATSLDLEWSGSGDASVSMSLLGSHADEDEPLAEDGERREPLAIIPAQVTVYVDDYADDIGQTALVERLSSKVSFSDLAALVKYLGADKGRVNTVPEATLEIVAELSDRVRTIQNTPGTQYVRIEAVGPEIAADAQPSLCVDLAVQISDESRGDVDAVYASTLTFNIVRAGDFVPRITLITDVDTFTGPGGDEDPDPDPDPDPNPEDD